MNGEQHNGFTKGIMLGVGASIATNALFNPSVAENTMVLMGLATGLLVGPDLDVDRGNISYRIWRRIGLEFFWLSWWSAYKLSFKHRSFWSHAPIIGTVLRLVYMVCPLLVWPFKDQPTKRTLLPDYFLAQLIGCAVMAGLYIVGGVIDIKWALPWFIGGLALADFGHALCDL